MRLIVDERPYPYEPGDSLLIAMLRAGVQPTGGGCLCLGGDCNNCLATVDGVSYVRTCQTAAKPGVVVQRHHLQKYPPLPEEDRAMPTVPARNLFCDVAVIGGGESGQTAVAAAEAAGKRVIVLEAANGQEAIGIYDGPLVVAHTETETLRVHAHDEIIVATGAAEIMPIVPGSELAGLLTSRAAEKLAQAGLDLGRMVAVGTPPVGVDCELAEGELIRFEGANGRLHTVITQTKDGQERRYACDTAVLGLGLHPRNALLRMGHGLPVRAVGDAARDSDIPTCPSEGMVCPCEGVSVADLEAVWDQGFHEMELVKRATLAGTGTCQGSVCLPYLRSFLQKKGKTLQPSFTARPVIRQITIGEVAAGAHHHATPRTALDGEHRRLGAQMERSGGWWRPWTYGDPDGEYWAVREAVSIMDVSTLGKMIVSGPDALPFLERLYPTKVATIKDGRSRYVLLLNERGYVFDDGMICKESDTRYTLTFTSSGVNHSEMWLRDWASSWSLDVHILNQTMSLGAINVTGPLTRQLLEKAGIANLPGWLGHQKGDVASVPCHIFRLSFTGELSYELHHPAEHSVKLWRTLLELGQPLGIRPHGMDTLLRLRLEKGHVIVGQDTDFDSTPRRIHHDWAVRLDKPQFIGRHAVGRTNKIPLDKMLVGLELPDGPAPIEGAVIWHDGAYAGYVTSSAYSPVLGKVVMLGWLYTFNGNLPEAVTIDGRIARRVPLPFYDKEARRARA
ncbi:glycine cleavage T C-terminal barrel domain-containing protein [Candidatus Leptofilum sp.]|uniref:glycine cleavage T C-terminal barrel domain-containing protein n=1 Tax=Candidatus Leptofilum sp. TaxID=3241576 RepID=UPI003B5A167C